MWLNQQFSDNLVTFIENILNGKLQFLSSLFLGVWNGNIDQKWVTF